MEKQIKSNIQVRRDTAANWSSSNRILLTGELGYDTTNKRTKMGDGTTPWNSLTWLADNASMTTALNGKEPTITTLPIAKGGTGNSTGLAASATKLATARSLRADLGNRSSGGVTFDGTGNVTSIPVVGSLETTNLTEPSFMASNVSLTAQPNFDVLRADRTAFLPAEQIIIEKSMDAGTTWTDAGINDTTKRSLFTGARPDIRIPLKNGVKSTDCMLRITITAMRYNIPANTPETSKYNYWNPTYVTGAERYCTLDTSWLWVNANSDRIHLQVQRATGANSSSWVTTGEGVMSGWSGGNFIKLSQSNFGGGIAQTGNYWNYRFVFRTCSTIGTFNDADLSTTYTTDPQAIIHIKTTGKNYWTTPNNLMRHDHLYSWDVDQNAIFPSAVSMTELRKGSYVYSLPSKNGTVALTSDVATTVSKAGDTMTGGLVTPSVTGKLLGTDTRSVNSPPSFYMSGRAGQLNEFKQVSTLGLSGLIRGTYCMLVTYNPWSDVGGGLPTQIAYGASSNGLCYRRGADATTWGAWEKLYTTGNKPTSTDVGLGNVQNVNQRNADNINSGTVGAAYLPKASILAEGIVKIGANLNITDGVLSGIVQEASSNMVNIPSVNWIATDDTYGKYKYEYIFGSGINYTDINYTVEVLKVVDAVNKIYVTAPCTVVRDNYTRKITVYTDDNTWNGVLILTSGGEGDSQQSGHQIFTGTGVDPLTGRTGLRFSDGLKAVDNASPAETRVSVDTASVSHNALKDLNGGAYLHLTNKEKETAIGINTIATGTGAHTEGYSELTTSTFGNITGLRNEAQGNGSHAEGIGTKAFGDGCHAEGTVGATTEDPATAQQVYTTSNGRGAHAEGCGTTANGKGSHSEGYNTIATGTGAHAEGRETQAKKFYSHAEGQKTIADGDAAHAEGYRTEASGAGSHAEGIRTTAKGDNSHAEGFSTYKYNANNDGNTAQDIESNWSNRADKFSIAFGNYSHVEGQDCMALGTHSHAEGQECIASGTYSHAEGQKTKATNTRSHAEGRSTLSSGNGSHAEGGGTQATADNAHSEGYNTKANNHSAHAEGMETIADGQGSHAEGRATQAIGSYSHAEGQGCVASGSKSHAEGKGTIAAGNDQHAQGRYNIEDTTGTYAHIVGGGTSAQRRNIHTLDWNGNAIYTGKVRATDFELTSGTLLKKSNVINALDSNITDSPLSAYQGKVLKGIIDGKEIGTAFTNISALITAVKTKPQNDYWVGFNLFVLTQDVPDFWISGKMSTVGNYSYSTDAEFINDVDSAKATGGLHVGYYKIGRSDLAKVDITNYIQRNQVVNNLVTTTSDLPLSANMGKSLEDRKVDKISGKGLSTNDYDNTEKGNVASNTSARHTHSNKTVLDGTTASYTTGEKNKLSGIEAGANNYTHPASHPATIITQTSSYRFVTDTEKNTWNNKADTDTKNTAGSTDTSSKIYLVGATSQGANPQTYSDNEVYVTSGALTTKTVSIGGGSCTLQYSDEAIKFVFN